MKKIKRKLRWKPCALVQGGKRVGSDYKLDAPAIQTSVKDAHQERSHFQIYRYASKVYAIGKREELSADRTHVYVWQFANSSGVL